MSNLIHIWKQEAIETENSVTNSVIIEDSERSQTELWYRVPSEHGSKITNSLDPFVVGAIFIAMKRGKNLHVHGDVSPSLLRNLEEFQTIWSCWRPYRYRQIEITADREREQYPADESAGYLVAFSGGVDSCFSTYRHATGKCGRLNRQLKAGVLVQGFDLPLDRNELFQHAYRISKDMLASLNLELLSVATNCTSLTENRELDTFAASAASCLMLFQKTYRGGILASTEPYDALVTPWGSHPLTDPLLSSDSFELIHDGAAFKRTEKIQELNNWSKGLAGLRVCWHGPKNDPNHNGGNCGYCEKCIRTILNFRVAGLELPACFEKDIDDAQILGIGHLNETSIKELEQILSLAEKASITESWVKALRICIQKNRLENQLRPRWHSFKEGFTKILPNK